MSSCESERPWSRCCVLNLVLDALQVLVVDDFVAVDDSNRCGWGHRRTTQEAGRFIQQEAADEQDGDDDPDVFRQAPHLLQHGTKLR